MIGAKDTGKKDACPCTQEAVIYMYALGQRFSNWTTQWVVKLTWWVEATIFKMQNRIENRNGPTSIRVHHT